MFIVIDFGDICFNFVVYFEVLCNVFNIVWDLVMLFWFVGGYKFDGVWVLYWYFEVWKSIGFVGLEGFVFEVFDVLQLLLNEVMGYYK